MIHRLMIEHLTSLPVLVNVVGFVGAAVVLTLIVSGQVHRRFGADELTRNNEVAGFKFGVLGAVYGLLVALALVAVWESYRRAQENAATEQSCIRSLRREALGLTAGGRAIGRAIHTYEVAADREWGTAVVEAQAVRALDEVGAILAAERNAHAEPFVSEALQRLDRLDDLRSARRESTEHGMPDFLWGVLVVGAITTVGFCMYFGSPNRTSQRVMSAILAGTLTLVLLAVLELDHPYTGPISVPSPFSAEVGTSR